MTPEEAKRLEPLYQLLSDLRDRGWLAPSDALLLEAERDALRARNEWLTAALVAIRDEDYRGRPSHASAIARAALSAQETHDG